MQSKGSGFARSRAEERAGQLSWSAVWRKSTATLAGDDRAGFTSAQELHEALEADGITIGLTTVYRTLHALVRSGRDDVVREKTGERLYRPRPTDGHRHYLVCRDCGLSTVVKADAVERRAEDVAATTGFTEVEHTVELTGVCDRCRVTATARGSTARGSTQRGSTGQHTGRPLAPGR
ncbi:Fur family transcriptional regulator [Streptomyces sp. AC627_RSS907]|uniref:Fur family transcriptional regulator n=1 Tax=Streptomyces sp. AC627_RSS907 TaxID=2823684 RepID=UPI001C272B4B|nr:transcriptional repressor [Streptomyces sp. AC627_RSS907]